MDELQDAKKWVIEARAALGEMNVGELYRVRISCPAHLHDKKQAVSNAAFVLGEALLSLQGDIEEEIEDDSS